jgi:hypothetical protein
MKMPGFFEGVVVALAAALAGTAVFAALQSLFSFDTAWRLLVAGLSLTYVLYLLSRSRERVGRATVVVLWMGMTGAAWLAGLPITVSVLMQLLAVWLVRSLYFHAHLLAVFVDGVLNGLALSAGVWALFHSGSLFLGIWCFFLVQAAFVFIPSSLPSAGKPFAPETEMDFQHARRTAESALRRLSSTH